MNERNVEDSHPLEMWPSPQGQRDLPQLQRRLIVGAARAAEATGESGELIIRRGTVVGRILFVDGQIAWIHCHGRHGYLADHIAERVGLSREELDDAISVSRTSGVPLGESLVAAGRISSEILQELLMSYVQVQLAAIFDLPDPVALLFLPVKRSYSGDFLHSVDDVLGELRSSIPAAFALDPNTVATLLSARAFTVQGAIGGGAVVTTEGRTSNYATRQSPTASPSEAKALASHAARLANQVALAVDVPEMLLALESVHIAKEYYVYERSLATATVFLVARAVGPIGAFMAAARAATRDLLS